jgi:hypothetical protein
MAAVFKNAIKTVSSGAEETVYTAPELKTSYIIECDIASTGATGIQVSVTLSKSSSSAYIVKGAPVPVGSAIQVVDGQKIVLEPGDSIKVKSTGGSADVILSLVEDVNS